ncbi:hypothetical protein B4U80_02990 [Leptotrombidium deliense]|uniref:Gamma-soluble NSF attachment protein n=1 Tax=Leptotrombidium deliense TaxID=299467 RepID=A0A443SR67_9ACAR|nr:hypothetical protein B4U80_02990 [Leptotrombidium deliense]
MSSKVAEAEECIREAEKWYVFAGGIRIFISYFMTITSLKTSMFKWKPDYDSAANAYQKAATAYKAAKLLDKCLDYNVKAGECFQKNRQYYSAAKCYEQVAMICGKEKNDWENAVKFFEKACALFREHGIPDTAALSLERGAKMLQNPLPEKAAEFYLLAAEVAMIENKSHQAAEFCSNAARLFLKLKKYEDAIDALNKQLGLLSEAESSRPCGRLVVCLVLVHLTREDFVAAQKAFNDGKCYVEDDEIYTMTQLLNGFDNMDSKQIISALDHPFIKSLDNEVTKLARSIQQKHGAMVQSTPVHGASYANETTNSTYEDEAGAMM